MVRIVGRPGIVELGPLVPLGRRDRARPILPQLDGPARDAGVLELLLDLLAAQHQVGDRLPRGRLRRLAAGLHFLEESPAGRASSRRRP
jgi:hypothetical protein